MIAESTYVVKTDRTTRVTSRSLPVLEQPIGKGLQYIRWRCTRLHIPQGSRQSDEILVGRVEVLITL